MERTLIIFKPDAIARGLVGEILARFERKGLAILGMKMIDVPARIAKEHYGEHKGKPFYKGLVEFITSGPVIAAVLEGRKAIHVVRKMLGATRGPDAEAGTIRGDYGLSDRNNLVHASDGPESARTEIARFFQPAELVAPPVREWVYDLSGKAPE